MTQVQSFVNELVAAGALSPEEAHRHPRRHVILQALGVGADVKVVVSFADLQPGDVIIVCSDGLSEKVTAEDMRDAIRTHWNMADACGHKDGAPQVRGTGAAQFDKPGRYPYALLTRLMTPSGPGKVERMLGEIVVGVPPTSEPGVPEPSPSGPSSLGPDVVRLRSSPDAARVYDYRSQQGIVIKIERTAVSPTALRAGE